nr:MAG TPA: hypothetical protein [Caudoviricetes sp.]
MADLPWFKRNRDNGKAGFIPLVPSEQAAAFGCKI